MQSWERHGQEILWQLFLAYKYCHPSGATRGTVPPNVSCEKGNKKFTWGHHLITYGQNCEGLLRNVSGFLHSSQKLNISGLDFHANAHFFLHIHLCSIKHFIVFLGDLDFLYAVCHAAAVLIRGNSYLIGAGFSCLRLFSFARDTRSRIFL